MNNHSSDPVSDSKQKLGLALSGGGFRASFFHIGALAAMAEAGLLRKVQVLSTVSGGSILGAHYYLHLQQILQDKPDEKIGDMDYVGVVQSIVSEFHDAVKKNLRMRIYSSLQKNWKMGKPNYSRSDRLGELYDKYFYQQAIDTTSEGFIKLSDLIIQPFGGPPDFSPDDHNAQRDNPVPILLLNATTLNTGHNWRFEAIRMGEPKIDARENSFLEDIDKNYRLLRPGDLDTIIDDSPEQFWDIQSPHNEFKLGYAVSASACVPVLFHPLAISNLFEDAPDENGKPDQVRVQLVDGGVHDNLGTEALGDRECTHFIVSDASGPLSDLPDPSSSALSVLGRMNSILMDRVREEELQRLKDQFGEDSEDHVTVMHLRRGLAPTRVRYYKRNGELSPKNKPDTSRTSSESFGVPEDIQHLISSIRTDLDSFSEIEAYSLMYDGYRMTMGELEKRKELFQTTFGIPMDPSKNRPKDGWLFDDIKPWFDKPTEQLRKHLRTGSKKAFKVYCTSPWWAILFSLLQLIPLAILGLFCYWLWLQIPLATSEITALGGGYFWLGIVMLAGGSFILTIFPWLSRWLGRLPTARRRVERIIHFFTRFVLPTAAAIFMWIHRAFFDWAFLRAGEVNEKNLGKPE